MSNSLQEEWLDSGAREGGAAPARSEGAGPVVHEGRQAAPAGLAKKLLLRFGFV